MIHSRLADWVLMCVVDPADREWAAGDLAEEYAIRARESRVQAVCWYWSQVLRSVPWFLWTSIRRSGSLATFTVALVACFVQAGIEVFAAAALRRLSTPDPLTAVLIGLAIVLSSLFLVSYLAARLRPGAGALLTLMTFAAVLIRSVATRPAALSVLHLAAAFAAPCAALGRYGVVDRTSGTATGRVSETKRDLTQTR